MPATTETAPLLAMLQRLLEAPAESLRAALVHACDVLAEGMPTDKVDAFVYDAGRDSLVAVGTSTQPLSELQKRLGLDVLPLSNGGRAVQVYRRGEPFRSGDVQNDPEELRGLKEGLRIRSHLAVPLEVAGERRGVLLLASLKPGLYSDSDAKFLAIVAHWIGVIVHRAKLIEQMERDARAEGRRSAAEDIVSVLAHDVRNYMSPVALRLHLLRHRAERDARGDDLADIQVAQRGIQRLSALISTLLDTTRIEQGLFELQRDAVDLVAAGREAAAMFESPQHAIVVRASGPVMVSADPVRLRQCLDNLLSNAVSHSPAGAAVELAVSAVEADGGRWGQVEVTDEGPGVPPGLLPRIFERFTSGRAEQGGVGLGLFLTERIVRAHGGSIQAGRAPGKGARFVLRLPIYEAD